VYRVDWLAQDLAMVQLLIYSDGLSCSVNQLQLSTTIANARDIVLSLISYYGRGVVLYM
jgi:hypothetical protein